MEESASWAAGQGDLAGAVRILRKSYNADVELAPESELEYPPPQPTAALARSRKLAAPSRSWPHTWEPTTEGSVLKR